MKCKKCSGRMMLERMYSDNKDYEIACIICGHREYVVKGSELGQWLTQKEKSLRHARGIIEPHSISI